MERKEAIEIIRKLYNKTFLFTKEDKEAMVTLMPELEEGEDEKVKKSLIRLVKAFYDVNFPTPEGLSRKDLLDWVEKQDEQKFADKIEPKFKVGDIITNGRIIGKVDENENNKYHGWFGYDKDLSVHYADIPDVENWHLWTIKDAKDGDVLADGNLPFIFKKIDNNKYSYAYCGISVDDGFKIESDGDSGEWTWMQDIKPATKEQRNLLFQKMKEAGYEWDADKKELKKIEQKPAEWSDEDEAIYYGVIETEQYMLDVVNGIKKFDVGNISIKEECTRELNWLRNRLKSLKDRVQPQPKQEWSEEDKQLYNDLSDTYFYNDEDYPEETYKLMLKRVLDWMTKRAKSLRPQSTWKPSDEQMADLWNMVCECRPADHQLLQDIYYGIKTLRGE